MKHIGTIFCTLGLIFGGCATAQAPCACDGEAVAGRSPDASAASFQLGPFALQAWPDTLHRWSWPDSLRLRAWPDSLRFFWLPDSLRLRAWPDSLRLRAWADSLRQGLPEGVRDGWARDRAAWAAEMDPGIVLWPDPSVDARIRTYGPGVSPEVIRNFGEEWERRAPRLPLPAPEAGPLFRWPDPPGE
ncbi:hypothetical protein AWN76_016420 [Rhodothermaceae bacterium RA]|nr:hypothetical protein AWN76_016420 [Rhodothermaceae bacterium RA]